MYKGKIPIFFFFLEGESAVQTNTWGKGHLPQHVATTVKYHSKHKRAAMTSLLTYICPQWNTIAVPFVYKMSPRQKTAGVSGEESYWSPKWWKVAFVSLFFGLLSPLKYVGLFYEERGKRGKVLDSIWRVQKEGQKRKYVECQHLLPIKQHTLYQQKKEECLDASHTQHNF